MHIQIPWVVLYFPSNLLAELGLWPEASCKIYAYAADPRTSTSIDRIFVAGRRSPQDHLLRCRSAGSCGLSAVSRRLLSIYVNDFWTQGNTRVVLPWVPKQLETNGCFLVVMKIPCVVTGGSGCLSFQLLILRKNWGFRGATILIRNPTITTPLNTLLCYGHETGWGRRRCWVRLSSGTSELGFHQPWPLGPLQY